MMAHPAARLLAEAGPTVSLAEAAEILSISYNTAGVAVRQGELGVRTLRYGQRWRIPTADLRRLVGLDPPDRRNTADQPRSTPA